MNRHLWPVIDTTPRDPKPMLEALGRLIEKAERNLAERLRSQQEEEASNKINPA